MEEMEEEEMEGEEMEEEKWTLDSMLYGGADVSIAPLSLCRRTSERATWH